MKHEVLVGNRDLYGIAALMIGAFVIWVWHAQVFAFPFWGQAPVLTLATGNLVLPADPMPVYLWLAQIFGAILGVELGLTVLGFLGGLVGVVGVSYVVLQLTDDRVQAILGAGLFILLPVMMRQAVVQESGGILAGFVLASLAVLVSPLSHRYQISGLLFGGAVGIHASVIWMLPGFWFLMREDQKNLQVWAIWAGGILVLSWGWVLLQVRASGGSGLAYLLGGVGVDNFGPGDLLSGLVAQLDLFVRLFGWGGFCLGLVGLLLLAFQNRELFLFLIFLGGPFLLYRVMNTAVADDAIYLAVWSPVLILGVGTAWRIGSQYLSEGLQETLQTMLWVVGISIIMVQAVCVFYTQNVWSDALERRRVYADKLEAFKQTVAQFRSQSQPEDLVIVIADPKRPGTLSLASAAAPLAWHLQRQVVFGQKSPGGIAFTLTARPAEPVWKLEKSQDKIDDMFIGQALRSGRRFYSMDPFPLLHTSQVNEWLSALPVLDSTYELRAGQWPSVEDPEAVAQAFRDAFDVYVSRGYSTDAAACLQAVIAYAPTDVTYLRKLGDLYMKMAVFPSAAVMYAKLLALQPDEEDAAVNLSGAYFSMDDLDKAIVVCEEFLIGHPFSPEIFFNLAGYYVHAERGEEARELYKLYMQMGDQAFRKDEALRALKELERL